MKTLVKVFDKAAPFTVYATDYGLFFEHDEHGDDYCARVFIDGADQIYDYDLCGVLPERVGAWLHREGYNVEWRTEYGGYWEVK